jgi:hypothetical protein
VQLLPALAAVQESVVPVLEVDAADNPVGALGTAEQVATLLALPPPQATVWSMPAETSAKKSRIIHLFFLGNLNEAPIPIRVRADMGNRLA